VVIGLLQLLFLKVLSLCSSAIVDDLQLTLPRDEAFVAYFYVNGLEPPLETRIPSVLLRQILEHLPFIPPSLMTIYQSKYGRPMEYSVIKDMLLEVVKFFKALYLCIDALDEISGDQLGRTLELLNELRDKGAHILYTTRTSSTATYQLNATETAIEVKMDSTHIRNDIEAFVSHQINESRRLKGRPELQRYIAEKFLERSNDS